MRDFKGMKRQRGRGRGGGNGGGGGGEKPQQQNANRAFDSNGPDSVKVRGNAQTVFEKYQQLARDATSAGDRVLAENYLQHAEHYFRLLRALQPQRPASEILGRDQFASGYDIDFEDEGAQAQSEAADEAAAAATEGGVVAESDGEPRDNRWQNERPRDDRQRDDRPRDDRPRDGQRDDRPRFENRERDDRNRDDRTRDRDGQGAQGGQANQAGQGGRRDRWRERDDRDRNRDRGEQRVGGDEPRPPRRRDRRERDRPDRDQPAMVEAQAAPVIEERPAQVLRDADGGESHAPAFLQAP